MKLVFVRHGESEANVLARGSGGGFCCGRWDCELTEKGREQAASLRGNPDVSGADHDHVRGVQEKSIIEHLSSKAEGAVAKRKILRQL